MKGPLQFVPPLPLAPEVKELRAGERALRVECEGVSLAWQESGDGIPVICLHSVGRCRRDFRQLQRQSPAGCRLLVLDWPGHGRSGPDPRSFTVERCVSVLSGFMTSTGTGSAILLGSEFGAAVALAFALKHPERVRGLVLCQPAGLVDLRARRSSLLVRAARAFFRRPLATPAGLEQKRTAACELDFAVQLNQAALSVQALGETLRSGIAHAACPILVVLSARSRNYPLREFEQFLGPAIGPDPLEQPGRPKLAILPGRQSPLWEDPARMAQLLSGFASSTSPLESHSHSWTLSAVDWPSRGLNHWRCTHPGCRAEQALPVDLNPNRPLEKP